VGLGAKLKGFKRQAGINGLHPVGRARRAPAIYSVWRLSPLSLAPKSNRSLAVIALGSFLARNHTQRRCSSGAMDL